MASTNPGPSQPLLDNAAVNTQNDTSHDAISNQDQPLQKLKDMAPGFTQALFEFDLVLGIERTARSAGILHGDHPDMREAKDILNSVSKKLAQMGMMRPITDLENEKLSKESMDVIKHSRRERTAGTRHSTSHRMLLAAAKLEWMLDQALYEHSGSEKRK